MQPSVLDATFTSADAAFALQHGNFGDFRRNLTRGDGFLRLPRATGPGAAGGDYRYGHLVEMLVHMHVASAFSREVAKNVTIALFSRLKHNDTGLRSFNELSREDQEAVRHGSQFTEEDDPSDLYWFVEFPHLVLNGDIISRNPASPTFVVFDPNRIIHDLEVILARGTDSLADIHSRMVRLSTAGYSDETTRQMVADSAQIPGILNLTGLLVRLDYLLGIRLNAKRPIGAKARPAAVVG